MYSGYISIKRSGLNLSRTWYININNTKFVIRYPINVVTRHAPNMFDAYRLTQTTPSDKQISWRYVFFEGWLNSIPSDNPVALEVTIAIVGFRGEQKTSELWEKPQNKDANQQQIQPTYETGSRIQTQATSAIVVECSHHLESPTDKRTILYLCSFVSII